MTLLEKIFLGVLNLSETGVLVILVVLLCRLALHKMPKKFSYVLWAIPALKLLVPISFRGIVRLPGRVAGLAARPKLPPATDGAALPDVGGQAFHAVAEHGPAQPPGGIHPPLLLILACLWMAGMAVLALKNVYDYVRLRKKLCVSMKWKEHIYLADGITQPFVLAGFPCRIYLPSGLGERERRYVLLHEQIHVKRKDAVFKLLASLICCVHWFNPFVWLGVYYFERDMEMSCDEAASDGLDATQKRAYALELLRFSAGKTGWRKLPCAFGEKGVKGRIMNLSEKKRSSKLALALAGAVVALAAVLLVPDFRGMERALPVAGAAKGGGMKRPPDAPDVRQGAGKEPQKGTLTEEKEAPDADGTAEKEIVVNHVPVSMRWRADEYSGAEMEMLASLVYDTFSEVYLAGERRPEQTYTLDGISYDSETPGDLKNIFSDTENSMIWRLFVTLPDNWREDKGMGMMQGETSQQQEYDLALVKNASGEWEVAGQAWRSYYDGTGSYRWPD